MDVQVAMARQHHRESLALDGAARQHRQERDRIIRQVRDSDPEYWSYARLAKAVGCSRELIAVIVKGV